jgi:hypothetical protein
VTVASSAGGALVVCTIQSYFGVHFLDKLQPPR